MTRLATTLTLILGFGYTYLLQTAVKEWPSRLLLGIPFLVVWLVPVLYWARAPQVRRPRDELLQRLAYLSMGWLSLFFLGAVLRDLLCLALYSAGNIELPELLVADGANQLLFAISMGGLVLGWRNARLGPRLREVRVPITDLPRDLEGLRIAQITDLHVGPTISGDYVQRVVNQVQAANVDLVAVTGDIVDGTVAELREKVAPLAALSAAGRVFFVLGNHEYYSGAKPWIEHFKSLGMQVLINSWSTLEFGTQARLVIGGVDDPAGRSYDPKARVEPAAAFGPKAEASDGTKTIRILLAHNPKVARAAAQLGFDLQLSGHTHGGQFMPWTWITWLIHRPHYLGLSRRKQLWIYVSPGTGSWGPPVRLGTRTELTVLQLCRA